MSPERCHFCRVAQGRYTEITRARCDDCAGAPVWACRGCLAVGRHDHNDPRPTPNFTPLEAWVVGS
jgi:hypothetical protein